MKKAQQRTNGKRDIVIRPIKEYYLLLWSCNTVLAYLHFPTVMLFKFTIKSHMLQEWSKLCSLCLGFLGSYSEPHSI